MNQSVGCEILLHQLPQHIDPPGRGAIDAQQFMASPSRHHMGAARMAVARSRGVVNEHCRVHDVDSLYIAGSAVFPTSGIANPTLTLLALAHRLGDRANGGEWSDWERVRTRNFGASGRTADGLGRWKCLLNAEIAWAEVSMQAGEWRVTPAAVSVYDTSELERLEPPPTSAQTEGVEAVAPLAFTSERTATRQ